MNMDKVQHWGSREEREAHLDELRQQARMEKQSGSTNLRRFNVGGKIVTYVPTVLTGLGSLLVATVKILIKKRWIVVGSTATVFAVRFMAQRIERGFSSAEIFLLSFGILAIATSLIFFLRPQGRKDKIGGILATLIGAVTLFFALKGL